MSGWSKLGRIFTVDDTILDEDFALIPDDDEHGAESTGQPLPDEQTVQEKKTPKRPKSSGGKRKTIRPHKLGGQEQEEKQPADAEKEQKRAAEQIKQQPVPPKLSEELYINRALVEKIFHLPTNADIIIRDFTISFPTPIQAFAVFMEGLSDKTIINSHVLEPLMMLAELPHHLPLNNRLETIKNRLLPGNQVMEYERWEDVTKNILAGSTAVFIDGAVKALIVETKGWEHRSVSDTKTESVVRGPHDAFTENLRSNTGLVRSRLKTDQLITEMLQIGELASTDLALMYVEGVVNPKLVREVKRRIQAVKVDFMQDSGQLEQYLEDKPYGFVPTMMATERPDRVASSLAEGFVVVFVGQSPYALILPTMIWSLMHTAEDAYLRFPFGSFLRLIRFFAFLTAMLLPGLYISITNYHPEMIPTDLMLTIAAAREKVPFPVVVEVLLMELSLELIREAGVRIPNVIGPTIGIVGALILGQAAVQAAVISPLLVIVVAVTALAAFTLPNYNFSFAVRTLRFAFIALAAFWGFYGITLGVMALMMHWINLKSFGVPMMSPVSPYMKSSPDVILRGQVFEQEIRPRPLWPTAKRKQKHLVRTWDPEVRDSQEAVRQYDREHPETSEEKRMEEKGAQKHDTAEQGGESS